MAQEQTTANDHHKAKQLQQQGIQAYEAWELDEAVDLFQSAIHFEPEEPDHLLQLAKALARSGDFDRALHALAEFMRLEPESPLTARFEQLFASGMDNVEQLLTDKMSEEEIALEQIGAAIQMWMEYRIALGRERLVIQDPESWAAALDYTVRKVNLEPVNREDIAALYGITDSRLRKRHSDLLRELDVMPCDYRYFTGEENPLDKLVEDRAVVPAGVLDEVPSLRMDRLRVELHVRQKEPTKGLG